MDHIQLQFNHFNIYSWFPMQSSTLAWILVQGPPKQNIILWVPHMTMEMGWMSHPCLSIKHYIIFQKAWATIWCLKMHLVFGVLPWSSMVPKNSLNIDVLGHNTFLLLSGTQHILTCSQEKKSSSRLDFSNAKNRRTNCLTNHVKTSYTIIEIYIKNLRFLLCFTVRSGLWKYVCNKEVELEASPPPW